MATATLGQSIVSGKKIKAQNLKSKKSGAPVVTKQSARKPARAAVVSDSVVRARIDFYTKELASQTLGAMGLNISDAIRLLMFRIAEERRLPFEVRVPNKRTATAIAQLESGKGRKVKSVKALMAHLNADD